MNCRPNDAHSHANEGNLAIIRSHWCNQIAHSYNIFTLPNKIMKTHFLTASALLSLALATVCSSALAQKKQVSCKLKSERIIQGREKQCLYVCPDQSLEGRTRKTDQACPSFITTKLE
jgi:hypothetical protein